MENSAVRAISQINIRDDLVLQLLLALQNAIWLRRYSVVAVLSTDINDQ